jgi:hypothetical protein
MGSYLFLTRVREGRRCEETSNSPEGKGATVRITFKDARKGVRELDLTDAEADRLGGRAVARRGRKPRAVTS